MLDDITGTLQSTPLHEAAGENDAEQVRRLLAEGAAVNARAFYNLTPLMDACSPLINNIRHRMKQVRESVAAKEKPRNAAETLKNMPRLDFKQAFAEMNQKREYDDVLPADDPTVPSLLLEYGADVNALDQAGDTALMKAASAGRVETMQVLSEHGADFRATNSDGLTPLMLAAQMRRLEAARLLLYWGADADARTPQGRTTLMTAAEGGRVEIAQMLLAREQDVNTVGVNGLTALLAAAIKGHDAMIAFLKGAGAGVGFLEATVLEDESAAQLPAPDPSERGAQWGWPALFWAAKQGKPDAIRLLTAHGISANATGRSGQAVLQTAVMRGDPECVRALLQAGADPNGAPDCRFTPVGWAAQNGQTEIMELLLAHGASAKTNSRQDKSTLSGAVMYGNHQTARRLLESGADPNEKAAGTMQLLTLATVRDDKEMVRLLLDFGAQPEKGDRAVMLSVMARDKPEIAAMLKQAAGISLHDLAKEGKTADLMQHLEGNANINLRGNFDETLLIAALRGKQTDTARALIEGGADVNATDRIGHTALLCAAMRGDMEVARLLIARGADLAASDHSGQTPLSCAALNGKTDMVTMLIEAGAKAGPVEAALLGDLSFVRNLLNAGADVDTRALGGMTPLMGASAGGHADTLSTLLVRRADINAVDEEGKTALAWAVSHKRLEAIHLLLDRGADVNLSGEDIRHAHYMEKHLQKQEGGESDIVRKMRFRRGSTPLGLAVAHDNREIIALLLQRGADVNSPHGFHGNTPLYAAAMAGRAEMVRFLLEHGADTTIKDATGQTALSMAEQFGKSPEVVAALRAHDTACAEKAAQS